MIGADCLVTRFEVREKNWVVAGEMSLGRSGNLTRIYALHSLTSGLRRHGFTWTELTMTRLVGARKKAASPAALFWTVTVNPRNNTINSNSKLHFVCFYLRKC